MTQVKQVNLVSRGNDGKLKAKKIMAAPYEFTLATRGKWEMVIADEDTTIGKGEFKEIKIKGILIQQDTIAMPCAFSHHALASVIKVASTNGPAPVEVDRLVDKAYILGQDDGGIRDGDLLAVINILPIMFTRNAKKPVSLKG